MFSLFLSFPARVRVHLKSSPWRRFVGRDASLPQHHRRAPLRSHGTTWRRGQRTALRSYGMFHWCRKL